MTADVVVIGAGPAGLAAATRAAEAGARVLLMDECPGPGGQIWRHRSRSTLPPVARRWLARLDRSGAPAATGVSATDLVIGHDGAPFTMHGARGDRPFRVDARAVVIATGARELFLPFPGWTLPNVIGVGAAQALVKSGMSVKGKRVVVAGSGPLLLAVAATLAREVAHVRLVAEQAAAQRVRGFALGLWRTPGRLLQAAAYRAALGRAPYLTGTWVIGAEGTPSVERAVLTDGRRRWTEECDLVAVGYGLVPNVELALLAGCDLQDGMVRVDQRQETSVPGIYCAGEPTGVGGVELAVVEGEIAGLAAAGNERVPPNLVARRARLQRFAAELRQAFALRDELRAAPGPDTIVCRCEDVRAGELDRGWSPRQAKLYTRAGMGPCQGRVCGAALSVLFGWPRDTVRPPAVAVPVGALLDPDDSPNPGRP